MQAGKRDWRTQESVLVVLDRSEDESIIRISANSAGAAVRHGEPFPPGTAIVFASWVAKKTSGGVLQRDDAGHLVRQRLNTIYSMRKCESPAKDGSTRQLGVWECRSYRAETSPDALLDPSGTPA